MMKESSMESTIMVVTAAIIGGAIGLAICLIAFWIADI